MTTRRSFLEGALGLACFALACGDDDAGFDAGRDDAGPDDAGRADAGRDDAGRTDAGRADAGGIDAGGDATVADTGADSRVDDAGGDAGDTCTSIGSSIADNHRGAPHSLTVPTADALAGTPQNYDITGAGDHPHMLAVSADHFATLLETGTVLVVSTPTDRHTHMVTLTCARP